MDRTYYVELNGVGLWVKNASTASVNEATGAFEIWGSGLLFVAPLAEIKYAIRTDRKEESHAG